LGERYSLIITSPADVVATPTLTPIVSDSQGRSSVRLDLADTVTSCRISVDAHSMSGRIGSTTTN
jgi:hypothetical protein